MKQFMNLELSGPATLTAVVEAVLQLSLQDETQIVELASSGKLQKAFPFRPSPPDRQPADFVSGDALVQASPGPLSTARRAALIQSSMPERRHAPDWRMAENANATERAFGEDLLQAFHDQEK